MKVGVIGCGFQGSLHVECLRALEDVEVVAVCDTDPSRLDEVRSTNPGARGHADYRDLLEQHELDLVTVCTMPLHHMRMTVDAFATGAHVLCEKPLALSAAEGREMLRAAAAADRTLGIGFNMRFTPNARIIKRHIESGALGRPLYTHAWAKSSQIPWWGEHYRKELSGGGALAATAVHFLDPRPVVRRIPEAAHGHGQRSPGLPHQAPVDGSGCGSCRSLQRGRPARGASPVRGRLLDDAPGELDRQHPLPRPTARRRGITAWMPSARTPRRSSIHPRSAANATVRSSNFCRPGRSATSRSRPRWRLSSPRPSERSGMGARLRSPVNRPW